MTQYAATAVSDIDPDGTLSLWFECSGHRAQLVRFKPYLTQTNHGRAVYIINAKHCISPTRSVAYHQAAGRSSPKGADEIQGRNAPLMMYAALRVAM